MPRILCIANQKGGVGKTTTAVNLAAALSRAGKKVLLVDMDPQCNATTGLGCQPADHHPLTGQTPLRQCVVHNALDNIDLIPGGRRFRDVEVLANSDPSFANRLIDHLTGETQWFDIVLIDCPPSLGRLTETALASSSEVLMPIQCEYFAMEGLTQMIGVIRRVMNSRHHQLQFGGILLTMYDSRLELTGEVEEQVREFFGEIVFQTVVPRDVAAAEAPSHGTSVLKHAPRSPAARAYIELCMEVLESE